MSHTYLTTEELATRMKYDARTIRNRLKDSVLLEGIHYFRPLAAARFFSSGKQSKKTCRNSLRTSGLVPMAGGGYLPWVEIRARADNEKLSLTSPTWIELPRADHAA